MRFDSEQVGKLNREFEDRGPEEILEWTVDTLHPRVAVASSFQSQGVVLIDMIMYVRKDARILSHDIGRLNQETYDVMGRIRVSYNTRSEVMFPDKEEEEHMVTERRLNLFYERNEKASG